MDESNPLHWRELLWAEARQGQQVWLRGKYDGKFDAWGPHEVCDPRKRELRTAGSDQTWHYGVEGLLVPEEHPECAKLLSVKDRSQEIGDFLEWLQSKKGVHLAAYYEEAGLSVYRCNVEQLLAEYFEIDLNKVEEEKLSMLKKMRIEAKDESSFDKDSDKKCPCGCPENLEV